LFACGRDAGIAMWGKRSVSNGKVHIMTNAINNQLFRYSDDMRIKSREVLGLTSEFTVGIVGRIEEQKNYPFLLETFKHVVRQEPSAVLIVVGRGSLDEEIRELARKKGIEKNVRFLGVRSDVPDLLNAFDVFVLPSFYEGLPVVLVEAQANGLPEIVANTITDEMAVTDLITYLPLGDAVEWSKRILTANCVDREKYASIVGNSGYGIELQAKKMENKYRELLKKRCKHE
jgi:glycosyltransferase involved in cell wall biosynthesis